jgi:hypothetical protein
VLKNFLAELPESLLTDAHYPAYCQIAGKWYNVYTMNSVFSHRSAAKYYVMPVIYLIHWLYFLLCCIYFF